ncbi:MAG: thioredoxin family protein [Chitinivibrionia bacterium]|nr:thioredoxin family protein [Chitinivibrionia bacterium]MCL1946360.1 thioredoxin family protein [Chitinivibrionia bacterium]
MKNAKIKAQKIIFLALFCCFSTVFAFFESFNFSDENELSFEVSFFNNDDTIIAAITINIPQDYHLYSNPKGPGVGKNLSINFDETDNILFAKKSVPKKFLPLDEPPDQWVWAWENEAIVFLAFLRENFSSTFIEISGVYCDVSCVPFFKTLEISPNDAKFSEKLMKIYANAENFPLFSDEESSEFLEFSIKENRRNFTLFSALFFAFIAGIILNFMPCVLPVLGIKILSFSQNVSKKTAFLRSLSFSAGIIFVFLILAIVAVQTKIWWGQQFQNPIFITALSIFMIIGALFLFDIFTLSPSQKIANLERKQDKSALLGNFIRGICATILATPCSGPFLGAIFTWALIDNSANAVFAVFSAVGIGMSAPYILLSIFGGVKISQKIGKYSIIIKRILGVILLLFAVFLLFSAHLDNFFQKDKKNLVWTEFSPELFEKAQKNGQSVIIEFTAKWCLNCKYNKITVYETKEIKRILREKNILALSADLTNENIPAQELQKKLNSKSIPFMAVFDGNDFTNPVIFYDVVSKKSVMSALKSVK